MACFGTPQELAIMKLAWRRGNATGRDIYEAPPECRKIAYTTMTKGMSIVECLLIPQRHHRIDSHRSPRRDICRDQRQHDHDRAAKHHGDGTLGGQVAN